MIRIEKLAIAAVLFVFTASLPFHLEAADVKIIREPWLSLCQEHFACYSQVSERETVRNALWMESLYASLFFITGQRPQPPAAPVHLYLFKNSKGLNAYRPAPAADQERGVYFFSPHADAVYIGVAAAATTPVQLVPAIGRHFFASLLPHAPLWLEVGVTAYLSNLAIENDHIQLGLPQAERLSSLRLEKPMPWHQILNLGRTEFASLNKRKARQFSAQSWILVHYLIHGQDGALRDKIGPYLDAVDRNEADAFLAVFALDESTLTSRMQIYLKQPDLGFNSIAVKELTKKQSVVAAIQPQEKAVRLAELLTLQGGGREAESEAFLHAALDIEPEYAPALGRLAYLKGRQDDAASSLELFARAIGTGQPDAWTCYQYAARLLNYESNVVPPAATETLIQARSLLQRAIDNDDTFAEPYVLYGRTFVSARSGLHSGISAMETAFARMPSRDDVAGDLLTLYVLDKDTLRANYLARDVIRPRWGDETAARLLADMAMNVFEQIKNNMDDIPPSETIQSLRYVLRFMSSGALREEAQGLLNEKEKNYAQSLLRQAKTGSDDERTVALLQEALSLQCDPQTESGVRALYTQSAKRLQRSLYTDAMMKANNNQFKQAEKMLLRAIDLNVNDEITRRCRDLLKMVQAVK